MAFWFLNKIIILDSVKTKYYSFNYYLLVNLLSCCFSNTENTVGRNVFTTFPIMQRVRVGHVVSICFVRFHRISAEGRVRTWETSRSRAKWTVWQTGMEERDFQTTMAVRVCSRINNNIWFLYIILLLLYINYTIITATLWVYIIHVKLFALYTRLYTHRRQ